MKKDVSPRQKTGAFFIFLKGVIPAKAPLSGAKAGIQVFEFWIPAFARLAEAIGEAQAGMTEGQQI